MTIGEREMPARTATIAPRGAGWRAWVLVLGLLTCAASRADALTVEEARHLLVRTGFGATAGEVDRLLPLSRDEAVDRLIADASVREDDPILPDWSDDNPMTIAGMADRGVADALLAAQGEALRAWWIGRMLASPHALRERMTLFWHDHFASALSKVGSAQLMLRQNRMLRRHALGDFAALLGDVVADPAMLVYLDGGANTSAAPNENLARELMELFTLGVGHYGEDDVREAARALTGWAVLPATGDAVFVAARHDGGTKTILGNTGPWDAGDVVAILLDTPQAARFIVAKLWAAFVSVPPPQPTLEALADGFRDGYAIAPLVRAILLDPAFWAPEERGALIAGPVDWAVGTLRMLDARDTPAEPIADLATDLGQTLFEPPNVAGWPGGATWIGPATLAQRKQAMQRFIGGRRDAATEGSLAARRSAALVRWLEGLSLAWRRPERLQALVLPRAPVAGGGTALPVAASPDPEVLADIVRGWLVDPVYQLR